MDLITSLLQTLQSRCSRDDLDTSKQYIMVKKVDGKVVEEEVGYFVKCYQMGSGDGMTLHWEFLKNGITIHIQDDMWGTIDGTELIGFKTK
jgi:hypothetical protein